MKWQPEIVARLMRTARLSRSATARNSDEFTWPPQATVEAFDFKTGRIVSLSTSLERDPAPHATEDIEENENDWGWTSGSAEGARDETPRAQRDVLLRPGKFVRPIAATLAGLVITGAAYLSVHLARDMRKSGKPASAQTNATSASLSSALPEAPIAPSSAKAAPARHTVVDSRRGNVENRRDRGRQAAPQAIGEQSAGIATKPALGWFSLSLPIQAEIFENQQFVGTSDGRRVMLPAGRHHLELVNESLRYREWRSVEIQSGKATSLAIALPAGRLQVNAIPWSEVLIDGRRVGETPLGDLRLPIGSHRIVFRHPMLGELTRTAMIVAGTSTRISVNFNQ